MNTYAEDGYLYFYATSPYSTWHCVHIPEWVAERHSMLDVRWLMRPSQPGCLAGALSHLPLGRRQTVSCSCNEFLTQMFVAHTDHILFGYFQRLRGRHFGLAFNISFFVFKSIFSLMYSSFPSLSRYHTVIAYLETHF